MKIDYVRALRTSQSERFVVRKAGVDSGLVELHYLANGTVQGTLIVFEGAGISEPDIPAVLTHIDEVLLPEVSFDDRKLLFTVVVGRVHGSYEAQPGVGPATVNAKANVSQKGSNHE
jgi:hypothetical protein